jgi:hypothetical protein
MASKMPASPTPEWVNSALRIRKLGVRISSGAHFSTLLLSGREATMQDLDRQFMGDVSHWSVHESYANVVEEVERRMVLKLDS